jgi:hypothetical protein
MVFVKQFFPRLFNFRKVVLILILSSGLGAVPLRSVLADGSGPQLITTPCPANLVCIGADRLQVDPIWWNDNKLNQISPETFALASQLLSNPYNTCGPATLTMMINFLNHLEKPSNPEQISIVDVLHMADKLGYYKPPHNDGSLGESDLRDIAEQFGFKQFYPKDGGSFLTYTDFMQQIEKGFPAIVGMRFAYDQTTGVYQPIADGSPWNHYAIIFGFTDDGKYLWMLNPHPGIGLNQDADVRLQLISPDAFRTSWTKDDGSDVTDYGEAIFLK